MSTSQDCIFCKIIAGDIPAQKLYEDELFVVIRDIAPQAKVHCLIIPKNHYPLLAGMSAAQAKDLGEIFARIPKIAVQSLGLANGYRLIINQGEDGRQTVFHLHVHILGGEKLELF